VRVATFLRRARSEGALERPRVAVRVTKLALDSWQVTSACAGEQLVGKSGERASAHAVSACKTRGGEAPNRIALPMLASVVIRTVRHEDDSGGGARLEDAPHSAPPIARRGGVEG